MKLLLKGCITWLE